MAQNKRRKMDLDATCSSASVNTQEMTTSVLHDGGEPDIAQQTAIANYGEESMDPQQADSDDGHLLNVSTDSIPPSGKPHMMLGTSDFVCLLGTKHESYYIDKTNLVDVFINKSSGGRVLVTAPRRFGKTINIAMLYAFFELQLSAEESEKLSEDEFQIRVKETNNYKLFQEHELAITKNLDLMKKHFGKYPVLHISFKRDGMIDSFDKVKEFCSRILSQTFKEHKYLLDSATLSLNEKDECRKWLKKEWNIKNDEETILFGLKTLVEYLYEHFHKKKIVLLIDEYDSIITEAILNVKATDELKKIIRFCTGIIEAAVKENVKQNWVQYAFITGISHISGMGLSGSNINSFCFLENHSFVPYYGLTTTEVQQLLQKTYGFDEQQIAVVEKKFNGYSTNEGVKIYNIWSVLAYASKAKENNATREWQDTGYIVGLKEAFRFPEIMRIIETKLLLDHPIEIKKLECFRLEQLLDLLNTIGNVDSQNVDDPDTDVFFSFILDQGYLSYVVNKPGQLVIPNEQIKEEFKEKIEGFKNKVFGTDNTCFKDCREFFLKISKMNCDLKDFKNFHVNLEAVLKKYATTWIKKNEENIRCTIKILVHDLGFTDCAELGFKFKSDGVERRRKIDLILIKDDFVMILEIKYKKSNEKAMFCMEDREYLKVLEDKDIIRGRPITRFVVMAISMDENGQVSIGYLQNNKNFDDTTFIP